MSSSRRYFGDFTGVEGVRREFARQPDDWRQNNALH